MSTENHTAAGRPNRSRVVAAVISDAELSPAQAQSAVGDEHFGAVVCFSGVVRNHDSGQDVASLAYSAHPTAGAVMEQVAAGIADEFDGIRIWVGHRIGALAIGDAALVCAVAAAHRGGAFTACSALVDRVKIEVPIWKEQVFADGTIEWVGAGTSA